MTKDTTKTLLRSGAAAIALFLATTAAAQQRQFDLPAQEAVMAIPEFARQAGIQISAPAAALKGIQTKELRGTHDARAALQTLIAGTGLEIAQDDGTLIVLRRATGEGRNAGEQGAGFSPAEAGAGTKRDDSEIVVTGTHIRGTAPVGSRLLMLDREDFRRGGFATVQDALRSEPVIFGGGVAEQAPLDAISRNSSYASSPNLRGLGSAATLTIVNGRRLAPGGFSGNYTDISFLPANLVERVEVLPDGASALYGSDAVGGVVNIILRRDYEGVETGARIGTVTKGDRLEYQFDQSFGKSWDSGSLLLAGEYSFREALKARDRDRLDGNHLKRGGTDWRPWNTNGYRCNPGTIVVDGQSYAIPAGQDGTSLEPSDFVPGTRNLCNLNRGGTALPEHERWSIIAMARQDIAPEFELFADFIYGKRRTKTSLLNTLRLTVPSSNAFYVNPTGGSGSFEVDLDLTEDLGAKTSYTNVASLLGTLGAELELGGGWRARGHISYANNRERVRLYRLSGNEVLLKAALADSDPARALNLFGDAASGDAATLARFARLAYSQTRVDADQFTANAAVDGSLFEMPGGPARMALGGEFRQSWLKSLNYTVDRSADGPPVTTAEPRFSQKVGALFTEFMLPVFGPESQKFLIQELTLSLALRHENYENIGSATVPRIGLRWVPTPGVALRSSWSKSFRAPTLTDLHGEASLHIDQRADLLNPTGSSVQLFLSGDNPDLQPERARNWSLGVDLQPASVPGLATSLTYYDIRYSGRIGSVDLMSAGNPVVEALVIRNPSRALIESICSQMPFSGNFSDRLGDCTTTAVDLIFDARYHNIGLVHQKGLDGIISYGFDVGTWAAHLSAAANYILKIKSQATSTAPIFDVVDTVGNPSEWKVRASAGVSRDGFGSTLFVNYHDSYRAMVLADSRKISGNLTFDLTFSYDTGEGRSLLNDLSLTLNVLNLFNKAPPFHDVAVGYDGNLGDITGRSVSIALRKRW